MLTVDAYHIDVSSLSSVSLSNAHFGGITSNSEFLFSFDFFGEKHADLQEMQSMYTEKWHIHTLNNNF